MTDEGDRWFAVEQDRKRERQQRASRAKRRAQRSAQREQELQRAFAGKTDVQMQITEWETDEHGNLCRKVFAE